MTNQEAFDKVIEHLIGQKWTKASQDGRCMYRSCDGSKCAVGAIIPDDEYTSGLEGEDVYGIFGSVPSFDELDVELLSRMQGLHDDGLPSKEMTAMIDYNFEDHFKNNVFQILKNIALDYKLEFKYKTKEELFPWN